MGKELDRSLEKWQGIKESEIPLRDGTLACSLCHKYRMDDGYRYLCDVCPLFKVGAGCVSDRSNWREYNNAYDDLYDTIYLDGGDIEPLLEQVKDRKLRNKLYKCILTMVNDLARARVYEAMYEKNSH